MGVSVVIPTTLERPACAGAIASAVRATGPIPDSEVLVVVNGPGTDSRSAPVRSDRIRVCHSTPGASAARNEGLRAARHDIVLFTDDDCVVPPSWCDRMVAALRDQAAVAGPARVAVTGPVTGYLDYQRFYDAPPVDATSARWALTLNFGVRRSRLGGTRFDTRSFSAVGRAVGGEDIDFSYRLRDCGVTIGWLSDADPVSHVLPDTVDEVTERFRNYGLALARLPRRPDGGQLTAGAAVAGLLSLRSGTWTPRRFREVTSEAVRQAFTTLELMLVSSLLIGYLERLRGEAGRPHIETENSGLDHGWRQLATRIEGLAAREPQAVWQRPPADPLRFADPTLTADESTSIFEAFTPILRRHLLIRDLETLPEPTGQSMTGEPYRSIMAMASELVRRRPQWSMTDLNAKLRAAGVGFMEGCHLFEQIAAGLA